MAYAVPRIIHSMGLLGLLATDILPSDLPRSVVSGKMGRFRPLERLAGRNIRDIPNQRTRTYPIFGLWYALRRAAAGSPERLRAANLWAGKAFGRRVIGENWDGIGGVFTFNSAGFEILDHAKELGMTTYMEQFVVPIGIRKAILEREEANFPDWGTDELGLGAHPEVVAREEEEWQKADVIVCPSTFVRDGIEARGGPVGRCVVVPYGVELPRERELSVGPPLKSDGRSLRVLFIGTVGLRKGTQYVLEAARELGCLVDFRVVGPVRVPSTIANQLARFVDLRGQVPHSMIDQHFEWADVLLLPSLAEGSATVTYEAIVRGIPVVCTPNTGSIVEHGLNGLVVPVGQAAPLINALERLATDPNLFLQLSEGARKSSHEASFDRYRERLAAVILSTFRAAE